MRGGLSVAWSVSVTEILVDWPGSHYVSKDAKQIELILNLYETV